MLINVLFIDKNRIIKELLVILCVFYALKMNICQLLITFLLQNGKKRLLLLLSVKKRAIFANIFVEYHKERLLVRFAATAVSFYFI